MVADFEGHRGIKKITTDWLIKWTIQGKRMESETLILLGGKKKKNIRSLTSYSYAIWIYIIRGGSRIGRMY